MNRAKEILKSFYGYSEFRKGQENIINEIISGNDVVAIMPTGGGKSICYQIPALILDGITVVISPLISLMKDQVDAINSMGIESAYINSTLSNEEINNIFQSVKDGHIKILYVAPERLESMEFLNLVSNIDISQVAVDEAHCVSQWGHDFRSSYKFIGRFINLLRKRPVVSAFTATATEEVRKDIVKLLELNNPKVFVSGFDRDNLKIIIEKGVNKAHYILDYLKENKDVSGIIYCATRKEVDSLCELINSRGIGCTKYHAGLSDVERKENQEDFVFDKVSVMVATNAFGMGIDKPNIRYVIHNNMPKNIEGYYQEIGRAGRDGEKSECILIFSPGDVQTQKYIIETGTLNPERKINELSKLQTMMDLVYSNGCYRRFILNYFGEDLEEDCNNCSNCEMEGELVDKTIDAQKVISCVYRMKRPFGIGVIIDVLRASKNKKIIELGLDQLSTYGIMKDYSKEGLKDFINTLISHRYIDYIGEYPVVRLNQSSIDILKGNEKVMFKEKIKAKRVSKNNELFDLLRSLRREIALEEGVPPYIVFGDNTLKEMSVRIPVNESQLSEISGVGEKKILKYGELFLNVIKEYVNVNNIEVKWESGLKINKDELEEKFKKSNGKDGKKKSFEITIDMLREGDKFHTIAKERELSITTVLSHIQQYLEEGNKIDFEIDFDSLFSKREEELVLDAIDKVGYSKLKPIKENLEEDVSYEKIRFIVTKLTINNLRKE
ncbi:DNA helicase RecQ [Clostridium perfringens]|uniref:DNA helicase RecQ n=1 Tax=Clostridium perfringens TaxID=1502 RepID=UPI001F06DB29|nr:DNA helicase RecQ [Clostridium perfringens]MCH1961665.1 DNA helicase RecQ [Clostridium perfringens]